MSTKHTIILTCDICKTESDNAYSWARIHISGSNKVMTFSLDREYDVCHECWKSHFHRLIHPPRAKAEA